MRNNSVSGCNGNTIPLEECKLTVKKTSSHFRMFVSFRRVRIDMTVKKTSSRFRTMLGHVSSVPFVKTSIDIQEIAVVVNCGDHLRRRACLVHLNLVVKNTILDPCSNANVNYLSVLH